jgi:transposase
MKKNNTNKAKKSQSARFERAKVKKIAAKQRITIGMDLGDVNSHICALDDDAVVINRDQVPSTKAGMTGYFSKLAACLVVIEVGTHSPWVSRLVASFGHEVIVANARRLKLISQSQRKNDRVDAETLARLGRADRKLLCPIQHRGAEAQRDLAVIRARAALVETRTALVNSARGLVKSLGERLKKADASGVDESLAEGLSEEIKAVVEPLLRAVGAINRQVKEYDDKIEGMAVRYPEVQLLKQVHGVGPLTGLAYVLTIEDANRFKRSRDVGPYLGLVPLQKDSGNSQPELNISKAGDKQLRTLLVQGAHCILRKGAPASDLRDWGLKKPQAGVDRQREGKQGGKRAKRRAIIGVARRLAVLLHHLWVGGEVYEPLYNRNRAQGATKKAA